MSQPHYIAIDHLARQATFWRDETTAEFIWYNGSARIDNHRVDINAMAHGCIYDSHLKQFVPQEGSNPEVIIAVRRSMRPQASIQNIGPQANIQNIERLLQAYVNASLQQNAAPASAPAEHPATRKKSNAAGM